MKEKRKKFLKRVGKGVLYTAATGGAYILAKGILNLILKKLTPEKELPHQKAEATSSSSAKI
jgi:hypothetical protein